MNNLSKLGKQLLEIWKQLGVSQRISVLAATIVLAGGLIGIAFWSSHTDYSLLYGKLSDTEASKVISALDDAKIPYKIGSGGGSILVPSDKVYEMRMQLAGKGIPSGDGVGFEIFDKPNFGISDFVQRANYTRALEGELARTIGQINDVEAARVMIVMPENRLLLDKDKHPTASVFVRVTGNTQLQPSSVNAIRFLVANSVEGLTPNYVSVVDNLGNTLSADDDNDSIAGLTSSQLAAQRNLEQYLSKKAQDMLEKVLGPGEAIVRVSAEINFDTLTTTQEKYDPDGQVIQTQTKDDDSTDSTTTSSTAAAGISANTSTETNTTRASAAPVTNTNNRKTTSTVNYDNGKITSNTTQVAGGIKRLSAAITIAAQYQGEGTERKVVNRTPAELDQLKQIVSDAIGIQSGANNMRGDSITLEEMPFNDEFATTVTRQLDQQQQRDFWWNLAKNLVYPALGLAALLILLQIFKRTPVQEIPIGVPVGKILNGANGNGNGNGNGHNHWLPEQQPGVVTVDVLNRLIKENPPNMSQAIRDWMSRGSTTER
jgi:flagellar M-ring protein FliF